LMMQEVFMVFGSQERALMVVEPPGDLGRRRVLEVDDRILVSREILLVKERTSTMQEAKIFEAGIITDSLGIEAREQGCGCRAVKTFVVKEDPDLQDSSWLLAAGF
jgi:hypothetical protein